jgi:ferredoxin
MTDHHLHVDMIACDAFGYCAELLPEIVELDEWGYPVVTGPITPGLLADAEAAAEACPRLALRIATGVARRPARPLPVVPAASRPGLENSTGARRT